MFNPLSCAGFVTEATGWIATGDCFKIRIGFVVLFFIIAVLRKWGGEELGIDFSFLFSLLIGLGSYTLIAILFGSFKFAFLIGIIGALVGGYGGGVFFGGGGDY